MRVWQAGRIAFLALLLASGAVACGEAAPAGEVTAPAMVVTLGADLTPTERDAMMRIFGLEPGQADEQGVTVLTVTNDEERALLADTVPLEQIGTMAISSALVEMRPEGAGISVERYNITYVTDAMYGNALVTAGVRDARVVVAAPVAVSGTAALTGIFKAFEQATGRQLPTAAKETAGKELVTTGELGEEIGSKAKAAELLARVKEQVAARDRRSREDVRRIVVQVAADLDIKLTEAQAERVTDVALQVARLNWQATDLRTQIQNVREQIADIAAGQNAGGLLQRLLDFLARLFSQFFATFVGLVNSWRH